MSEDICINSQKGFWHFIQFDKGVVSNHVWAFFSGYFVLKITNRQHKLFFNKK